MNHQGQWTRITSQRRVVGGGGGTGKLKLAKFYNNKNYFVQRGDLSFSDSIRTKTVCKNTHVDIENRHFSYQKRKEDLWPRCKKVQIGKDQEKAQSKKDSHSKNRGGKKQTNNQVLIP